MFKILLIDDQEDIRELASVGFDLLDGFILTEASTGEEGLEVARREVPDLVLLDFMMPGLSGPDVIKCLKECPRTACLPVVFMTARATGEDEILMTSLGAAGVIRKPFDPLQLPLEISKYLKKSRAAA